MEITWKNLAAVIIPTLLTVVGTSVDNAMRWRSEMEQKQFDRQTKILDQIINIPDAQRRRTLAEFYVSTGVFTGGYKKELEKTLEAANNEIASQLSATATPASGTVAAEEQPTLVLQPVPDSNISWEGPKVGKLPEQILPVPSIGEIEKQLALVTPEQPPAVAAAPDFLGDTPPPSPLEPPQVVDPPPVQNIFLFDNLTKGKP